ncbi:MAG: ABC transporter ATP-binding protein [Rhodospirillales bacterium]|nr:MAG: ABC transporter ATP-binding protein [Rhodospirillales bacterium]
MKASPVDPLNADGATPREAAGLRPAWRWLAGFVRPYAARLAAVLMLSVLGTGLALAQPYITRYLIDDGLLAGRMDVILVLCAVLVATAATGALLTGLNRWQYVDASARILFALREAVYAHLQRLSPTFYSRVRGGDVMQRLDGDVGEVQRFAVDGLLALVNGVIALTGTLILMVTLSWQLSLLALLVLPAQLLFLRHMRPRVESRTREVRERASDLSSFIVEALAAMKLVQSVGAEHRQSERLRELHGEYRDDLLRQQMTGYVTTAVPGLMTVASTALVFVIGGWMVIEGALSLGALVAFSIYLARASGPVQTLLGLYVAVRRAMVSLERVMAIMDAPPAVSVPATPRPLPAGAAGEVVLEQVSFAYAGSAQPVLRDLSAAFSSGRKTGLVGASGVGKSTLIDLMHRHYDPDSGRILLDGVDLRALDLAELRRRIAVVAQDTVLLTGSIIDNIRYAAPWAEEDGVLQAARSARVDEFAERLPDGYHSQVGSGGAALSGGQRQRIAIARALLQDPLVLILDEATAAIDLETESSIGRAIDALFADRTRIVISHRAETLAGADAIFDMNDGRLEPRAPLGPARSLP